MTGAPRAATQQPLTVDDWLLAMLSAPHEERQWVFTRGIPGHIGIRIRCELHAQTFNWYTLRKHLDATETAWRDQHAAEDGPNAALHKPGDLYEEGDTDAAPRWPASACRTCGAAIVWTNTTGGKRMPLDASPSASGNVVLADQGPGMPPLAIVLHTESDRDQVPADKLHVAHFVTCPNAAKHRRPR